MSGANDSTAVSGANDSTAVSGANDSTVTEGQHAPEPHIQVVKGRPTELEIGAVIAVLAAASGTPGEPREQEENLWGHPVDRLRYSFFSWQKVTLQGRTHLRHR